MEPEEVWEEVAVEAGEEVPDLVMAPPGSVYVPHVALLFLIKQGYLVIK